MRTLYKFLRAGVVSALFVQVGFAQKENVGIGTTKPDQSAILDLSSTNKGLLMPRVSLQQRNSIQNPANGLIVYQTDMLSGFYYYDGKEWKSVGAETTQNSVADDFNWGLTGNSITTASNFLGTTDAQPLRFRTNNAENMILSTDGLLSITPNGIGKKVTFYDGGNPINHYGIGVSPFQLNYHTLADGSHVFYSGGNNGNGTPVMKLNSFSLRNLELTGNIYATSSTTAGPTIFPLAGKSTVASKNAAFKVENDNGGFVEFGVGGSSTVFSNTSYFYSPQPNFEIHAGGNPAKMRVVNNGVVVIGSNVDNVPVTGAYKLYVETGILTEKLKVALKSDAANWADYVFDKDYKLMPLEDVEKYTKEHKHLPNVPSANEITKEGLDVAQVSKMFMEKIEELTLHVIELNKKIKELESKK